MGGMRTRAKAATFCGPTAREYLAARIEATKMLVVRAAALSLVLAPLCAQNERPPEAFSLAIGLQQRGLHDDAARQFEQFLQQHGKHALAAEASYRLGLARIELGQQDAAIRALQQALQTGGASFALQPECRYRLGNLLEGKKDHRAALAQFQALAAAVPADHYLLAAARYAEGEAWRELGDDAKAAAAFTAAASASTGERATYRFPALYQLGFAELRQGRFADAGATFALAAQSAGDAAAKAECFFLSGDALLRLKEHDAAEKAFAAAKKLGGEFADDAAHGLGWVALGRGDRKAAITAFGAMLEQFPSSPLAPHARLERGRALYQEQQAQAAQQDLQPLLADGVPAPIRQQAQELLGLCALATGSGEAAVATLQQALAAAAPTDRPRLSFALGEALANVGRWEDAVKAYDAVPASASPELRGDAAYGACFALHSLGRHQESIARAEIVLALQPPHRLVDDARLAIAENRFALQQYDAAEKGYAVLADRPAHRETARWKLAWCRYLQGDKKGAVPRFAAVAAEQASPHAEEALAMQSLAALEADDGDAALALADQYRARYRDGAYLDRTERVAARVLRQRNDLAGAQTRLQRAAAAAKAHGGDDAASGDLVEQAELCYQQGDYKAADATFAKLVARQDATGARACSGRAWCAFELGDDDACGKALATAKAHPAAAGELPQLLELESALQHRRQDWKGAVATATAFLQRFPDHAKAPAMRYALGTAQARGGDSKAARATLAALAKTGGVERMDRVHYELAWACRRDGDEAAALAAFRQVAEGSADPELAGEARLHVGVAALEQKDLAGARKSLEAVQGSHRGRALYRLAFAELEAAGTDAKALATARDRFAAVAALPGEALAGEARYLGAECCHRLGDPRGAVERLQPLLQQEPQHARADRARLLLGECAVALGDGAVAVPPLEQFLRGRDHERADVARANLMLGRARALRREHDAAEACYVKVTELSDGPLAAEAQFRIGENRVERGDLRGAADAFVKLPILYAHPEWVRMGLLQAGIVYEKLQQPDKAQRFFRELAEKHAGSAEAKVANERLRAN
jgi:TolA-binding protein